MGLRIKCLGLGVTALALLLLLGSAPRLVTAQAPTATPTGPTLTPSETRTPSLSPTPYPTNAIVSGSFTPVTMIPPHQCGTIWDPCSPLAWPVFAFPTLDLPSPTFRPTLPSPTPIPASATPTLTLTPTLTATVTPGGSLAPTATSLVDIDSVSTLVGGFNGISQTMVAQSTQSITIDGTPQGVSALADQLGQHIAPLFAALKGFQAVTHNKTLGLISFLFLLLIFAILVTLATMFLPTLMRLISFVLQVIGAFKP